MARTPTKQLPPDVEVGQRWRAPDGQHYEVAEILNDVAMLVRATPAGRVLNRRYRQRVEVDKMLAEYKLVNE